MSQNFSEGNVPLASDPVRRLLVKQLNAVNAGGGGSGSPDAINYAGPPVTNPPALQNIVVDSNGRQWMYYGGAWN